MIKHLILFQGSALKAFILSRQRYSTRVGKSNDKITRLHSNVGANDLIKVDFQALKIC